MNNSEAYGAIASLYEQLMEVDYDEWADYVRSRIDPLLKGKTGIDVGCGSGAFTRRLKKFGYDVIGVDLSADMLSVAEKNAKEEGLNIVFVRQDMRKLKVFSRVDFITAITDCLNYVSNDDMLKTFKKFASSLKKGGVLFFDISTEYKLKTVIDDNMFGEDGEDFSYMWFNTPFEGGVEMDITAFTKEKSGLYSKKEEHHVQYIHTSNEVRSALEAAGFDVVMQEGHLGSEITDNALRTNFLAVKR